jgi:hypothetical protein
MAQDTQTKWIVAPSEKAALDLLQDYKKYKTLFSDSYDEAFRILDDLRRHGKRWAIWEMTFVVTITRK